MLISKENKVAYAYVLTQEVLAALEALATLNKVQKEVMEQRNQRRRERIQNNSELTFLSPSQTIAGTNLSVKDIRAGNFISSPIPEALKRQWIQGTGPATKPRGSRANRLRNVAYALLSGADGWMFDAEDALGQINTMSLDNQENLKLALNRDPLFMQVAREVSVQMNAWAKDFFGKEIITDWEAQLDFTTLIFRARGLHLDDRHITMDDGTSFSASITDTVVFVVNNYLQLQQRQACIVLYLPKIQTATEAAFWNKLLENLESYLGLEIGTIKVYVLIEQLEATFQLQEIRAVLGEHFVGFNTGRWDYINSVSDAKCADPNFINPNIESITMTYAYMAAYEDRVRRAMNTPDKRGNYSLWQGGMEPNIPVGSAEGVKSGMAKALAGAQREQKAGASGKWVAHWKMVHIIRPVWEKIGQNNQLGRDFPPLTYTAADAKDLVRLEDAPRTIQGARNLLSVALQYGNAFLQGFQAAALKPADYFDDDNILYLMEDMATGEIRLSVLWEWVHKRAELTEPDTGVKFSLSFYQQLLEEEYAKLLKAKDKDVHDDSKKTTLPIVKLIAENYVKQPVKAPWYIDLLNLNIDNEDFDSAKTRIENYYDQLIKTGGRITARQ